MYLRVCYSYTIGLPDIHECSILSIAYRLTCMMVRTLMVFAIFGIARALAHYTAPIWDYLRTLHTPLAAPLIFSATTIFSATIIQIGKYYVTPRQKSYMQALCIYPLHYHCISQVLALGECGECAQYGQTMGSTQRERTLKISRFFSLILRRLHQ